MIFIRLKKRCGDLNPEVISEGTKLLQDDENDIFGELLGGTSAAVGKTVNQQSLKTLKCMTLIDAGSAVLFEHGLRTFLPIKDKMVCCRASEQGYLLSMYGPVAANTDIVTPAYAALPMFRITVEVPSVISSVEESQRSRYWGYIPQLCCLQPGDTVSCSASCTVVERPFFNKLFNCEASLLDSPVTVFGGVDGQILFWPMNSFALTSTSSESVGGKQSFTPKLLYHLQQRVSAIYAASLCCQKASSDVGSASITNEPGSSDKHNKESTGYCNALIFVGDRDKIVIASECLSQKAEEVSAINFAGHTILGPVLCSCLSHNGDTLIHSTGKEIFVTKLSINYSETGAANFALVSLSTCMSMSLITLSMQIPNICTVCCVDKKNKTAGTKTQVYALTVDGKLLQFVLPELQDGQSPIYSNAVSPQMAGEKVKSYLREIETQSAELAKVTATIETEDRVLKELNMVIHTACQLAEDATVCGKRTMPHQDMFPLCCTFTPTVGHCDSSGNSSMSLHFKVVNQGSLVLSSSWSLMVHIQGKEPWCRQVTAESYTVSRSVPLKILNPGSFLEIDIPLSKSSSFHIVAEVHLYCNLNSLVADLRRAPDSGHFFKKPVEDVVIPISRHMFDVLHFVRPNQMGSQVPVQSTVPGSKAELLRTLDKLDSETRHAMNKESLFGHGGAKDAEVSLQLGNGSYSAFFHVSQDAVSFMKTAIQKNTAQNLTKATPQATVLQFILTDSSISHQHIDSEYSGIDLLTVNGSRASIQVKPVNGSTTSADSPPLEVALYCSSIPVLCRLHEAVLTRMKVSQPKWRQSCLRVLTLGT